MSKVFACSIPGSARKLGSCRIARIHCDTLCFVSFEHGCSLPSRMCHFTLDPVGSAGRVPAERALGHRRHTRIQISAAIVVNYGRNFCDRRRRRQRCTPRPRMAERMHAVEPLRQYRRRRRRLGRAPHGSAHRNPGWNRRRGGGITGVGSSRSGRRRQNDLRKQRGVEVTFRRLSPVENRTSRRQRHPRARQRRMKSWPPQIQTPNRVGNIASRFWVNQVLGFVRRIYASAKIIT